MESIGLEYSSYISYNAVLNERAVNRVREQSAENHDLRFSAKEAEVDVKVSVSSTPFWHAFYPRKQHIIAE